MFVILEEISCVPSVASEQNLERSTPLEMTGNVSSRATPRDLLRSLEISPCATFDYAELCRDSG